MQENKRPDVKYFGRKPSSSSATGLVKIHNAELQAFIKEVYEY